MATEFASYSFAVPADPVATTNLAMCSYDPELARVRVDVAEIAGEPGFEADSTATVERSTDLLRWAPVRGGADVPLTAYTRPVDDYEFASGAENTYRATVEVDGSVLAIYTDQIAPVSSGVWLKHVRYAFLNRQVTVADYGDVTRPSRDGVFAVVGASDPVVVSDVRGARRYDLQVLTSSLPDAEAFDRLLDPGGVVYLQPGDCPVPGGHYTIGDTSQARTARRTNRRVFTLPLTAIRPPAATLEAATATWHTVTRLYPTWADLVADQATWADVTDLVGEPEDVVT
ncbi:MAG: hypothetical protein ACRDMV_06115 [Streptosporangiales bacterium]